MSRPAALVLAGLATLLVSVLLVSRLTGSTGRELHVQFTNAGGVVEGGAVRIGGRNVGSIESVDLADDGIADVRVSLDDDVELRDGTRATIRALGQAGITNRYIALTPGSESAPKLGHGATIPPLQTTSIVNIDALLDSFGPQNRERLQRLLASSADVYAGAGAESLDSALGKLPVTLRQLQRFAGELASDEVAVRRLVTSTARASSAVASRSDDLERAVSGTARLLTTVADERASLDGLLRRAPAVLDQARGTLAGVRRTTAALRPVLRDVPPVAGPLYRTLRKTRAATAGTRPVAARLARTLPDLRRGLDGFSALERSAVPALRSAGAALDAARPILRGARFYGSDLLLGVFNGFVGIATANYARGGHYARLEFVQPPQVALNGALAEIFTGRPLVPGLFDLRTGLTRRCPGGNTPPAADNSNPWVADPALCDPDHNVRADVNQPPGG